MEYSAKVNVKGTTYSIAFMPATGTIKCVNCGTLRTITSAKTLATIFAAWADQDHAEALEMNAVWDEKGAVINDRAFITYWDWSDIKSWLTAARSWEAIRNEALDINASFEAKKEDYQDAYNALPPFSKAVAWVEAFDEALEIDKAFETQSAIKKFSAFAPYIIGNVMAHLNGDESEDQSLAIIHEEILHYFEAHQNMTMQYLSFNEDQRKVFAEMMYDIHKEKGVKVAPRLNPVYEKFVRETGKTGSLDFICHRLSGADETSFNIYQRADGMQIAVDQLGTTRFMRPFKQAKWLRAGFEANLEFYWLVERGIKITTDTNQIASYENGFLDVEDFES